MDTVRYDRVGVAGLAAAVVALAIAASDAAAAATTERVSLNTLGLQQSTSSFRASISGDGQRVA
jgi:hypothetical protein